jgi:hypothetical protein
LLQNLRRKEAKIFTLLFKACTIMSILNSMINNVLSTPISDSLLQQIRDYLDQEADLTCGGCDPAQDAEPNEAMKLLKLLDKATNGELFAARRGRKY